MSTLWFRRCAFACALFATATVVSGDAPPASTAAVPTKAEPTAEDRIQAALDSRQPFECKDLTIGELGALMQKQYRIPVILDKATIEEARPGKEPSLSLATNDVSLRSCLTFLLRPYGFDYTIADEALVITTREWTQSNLRKEVFAVDDLTVSPAKRPGELLFDDDFGWDDEAVLELVTTTIQPDSWDAAGGTGSARVYRGLLVVSQTVDALAEIKTLLAGLRVAKKNGPGAGSDNTSIDLLEPGAKRLLAALHGKATLSVKDQPLDAVVKQLSQAHKLPFVIDRLKLEEAGKRAEDVCISVDLTDMSLRSLLRHTLGPHELGFIVKNDHIEITTKENCHSTLEVRIYPVRDLIAADEASAEPDYDGLKELIQTTVAPATWDAATGPGSIREIDPAGVLVFSQTQEVHEDVAEFLTRLRKVRAEQAGGKKQGGEGAPASQMTVRVYQIGSPLESGGKPDAPADMAKRLEDSSGDVANLVRDLIEPESWKKEPQAYMRALPGRLVVRHRPAVHQQIALLLEKLTMPQASAGGSGGGAPF